MFPVVRGVEMWVLVLFLKTRSCRAKTSSFYVGVRACARECVY